MLDCEYDKEAAKFGGASTADEFYGVMQEISSYLRPTVLTPKEQISPLLFWNHQCEAYANLSVIAKYYLTPSTSSMAVKSIFSITSIAKNSKCSSIAPHRLNRLSFVH
jgi:hypothetical protein